MIERIKPRLTYANVMVTILAFVVLGGSAYAGLSGRIGANDIKRDAVRGKHIKAGTITKRDLGFKVTGPPGLLQTETVNDVNLAAGGTLPLSVGCPGQTSISGGWAFESPDIRVIRSVPPSPGAPTGAWTIVFQATAAVNDVTLTGYALCQPL